LIIPTRTRVKRLYLCLSLCLVFCVCGGNTRTAVVETQKPVEPQTPERAACSPQSLHARMEEFARVTEGPVGAAVQIVEGGELVAFNGGQKFPMQSVYKLPIGMAVLRQVDLGKLNLEQKIAVRKEDFVTAGQYSPIRDKNPRGVELTLRELLRFMISESDGTACDVLLRVLGGPSEATNYLVELGVGDVIVATTENEMGHDETAQYRNYATPEASVALLRALQEGRGLSAESRSLLLDFMVNSTRGVKRIKGALPSGTIVAHKTGTSGTTRGLTRATNDIGLITLPDGRHLAVAVYVSDTKADEATREGVIAKISRAAWDCWTGQ
jgi:beta-lactamase class A